MPNVFDFKEVWENQYEISHYVAPVYKAFADESLKSNLYVGKTLHRTATGDFVTNDMGSTGAYAPQPWQEADETLTINYAKEVSVTIKKQDLFMTHLPNAVKRAQKSMNRVFNQVDADVFTVLYQGAGQVVDASTLSLQSSDVGTPIVPSQANIPNIFFAAEQMLIMNNVDYTPTGKWTGQYKLDRKQNLPVAVISAQLYNFLGLYLGGKTSALGDRVSQSGNIGMFANFNVFVSNALPWTATVNMSVNPTNLDTLTLLSGVTKNIGGVTSSQAVTFRFVTGTPTLAGDVKVDATNAYTTLLNLSNAIAAPSTTTATFIGFPTLSIFQQLVLKNASLTQATGTSTTAALLIKGSGNIPFSTSFTSGSNGITNPVQHNLFGVSKSVSLVMPRMAQMTTRPTPAYTVSDDYIAWTYYGIKVFADQAPGVIDVQISTAGFTSMPNLTTN